MLPVRVSTFIELFSSWARTQSDIEAVALVGSYAREAAVEDSDVDLVILTADPDRFLRDRSRGPRRVPALRDGGLRYSVKSRATKTRIMAG